MGCSLFVFWGKIEANFGSYGEKFICIFVPFGCPEIVTEVNGSFQGVAFDFWFTHFFCLLFETFSIFFL